MKILETFEKTSRLLKEATRAPSAFIFEDYKDFTDSVDTGKHILKNGDLVKIIKGKEAGMYYYIPYTSGKLVTM